ncbi:hypothetical protein [Aureimonas phyllosphaerae]|uniref:Uncharacterized protein n=1 Tax=Aureimonas phyllosphaerae TaxID=1166078 RepID=A0A7W6FV16_9HYPH|nr:hypothetical protein [Aureimonas phyllosphaerae]MBB3935582.1 hypothetical protein [Aureimonas phyllosphaerae]MBB3959590.1 hypothetical protein [Aureimonas phyllosphaerae]SFF12585.1 hypothetical protein SAMN05216566_103114 [Aureimonas phyllosphaerae]
MTSWLIDAVLVAALLVTSWRTGLMYKELKRLRSEETGFRQALEDADASINRAANAVVLLKSEGVRTLRALEERAAEAQELVERLDILLDSYEQKRGAPVTAAAIPHDNDAISRFASVTSANR